MTGAATSRAFAALALPGAIDLLTAAAEGRPPGPSEVLDALLDAGGVVALTPEQVAPRLQQTVGDVGTVLGSRHGGAPGRGRMAK